MAVRGRADEGPALAGRAARGHHAPAAVEEGMERLHNCDECGTKFDLTERANEEGWSSFCSEECAAEWRMRMGLEDQS